MANTQTENEKFDIAVVGGGLNGALCAIAMADAGFSVALIDADIPDFKTTDQFDGRTSALAFASVRLLQRLGLWEAVEPEAGAIRDIICTDGTASDRFNSGGQAQGMLHFDSRDLGGDASDTPLGWICENRHLRRSFLQGVEVRDNISVIAPARVIGTKTRPDAIMLTLESGQMVTAALAIAADGRRSPLRQRAHIRTVEKDFKQTAIVTTVAHEKPHNGIAQEFFLPTGPFAILPLAGQNDDGKMSSIVWSEQTRTASALTALPEADFLEMLQRRFGDYLGALSLAGPIWSHPLSFLLAAKFFGERLVLIGDAAHVIHPIAGQGFNLGIKDIATLVDLLSEARQTGLEIGHGSVLERYQRWRYFDCAVYGYGTNALNHLYTYDNPAIRSLRSAGMSLVNKIDPLRRGLMHQAGANAGDLPSLLKP